MRTKKLVFNGVSSLDMGVVIQTPPAYEFPDRDVSITHVPGRNGDIVVDNNCYKNVNRTYNLAKVFHDDSGLVLNAQALLSWLTAPRGKYVRLEDDYDPDVYRLASFVNAGSFTDLFNKAYALNVTFNCKPQRFLKSGEEEKVFVGPNAFIENPSNYKALPTIGLEHRPTQSDSVLMMSVNKNQNGANVSIRKSDASIIYIDSEKQNCYDDNNNEINELIGLNGKSFPTLDGGINTIEVAQYKEINGVIQPYLSEVVNEVQETVTSAYKNYEILENAAQDKRYIKAYGALIDSKEDYYDAQSYQAYINDLCKEETYANKTLATRYYLTTEEGYAFEFRPGFVDADFSVDPEFYNQGELRIPAKDDYCIIQRDPTNNYATARYYYDGSDWILDHIISEEYLSQDDIYELMKDDITESETINYLVTDEYTFDSFNSILQQYAKTYTYTGRLSENDLPYWLTAQEDIEGTNVILIANTNGFFIVGDKKRILYYAKDDNLLPVQLATDQSITITFYETTMIDNIGYINIGYADIPEWLDFNIKYGVSSNKRTPTAVEFKTKLEGYYWTDKEGWFGKSKWTKLNPGVTLNELKWSELKKAFEFNFSTTAKFTYKYLREKVDYKVVDDNPVHFSVNLIGEDLTKMNLVALDSGYYKVTTATDVKKDIKRSWDHVPAGSQIFGNMPTTESFEVEYLEDLPDYSEEENWPEWLDPDPINMDNKAAIILNADKISFKVNEEAKYRITVTKEDPNDTYTLWCENNKYSILKIKETESTEPHELQNSVDNPFYICKIDATPTPYDNDRAYGMYDKTEKVIVDYPDPPVWLSVTYELNNRIPAEVRNTIYEEIEKQSISLSAFLKIPENIKKYNATIDDIDVVYKSVGNGFYRWDNNSSWFKKSDNQDLLVTGYKDTTVFYYMEGTTLPAYAEHPLNDIIRLKPMTDIVGNPNEINFIALVDGYYRINSESDWKWYKENDVMFVGSPSSVTTVYHLENYPNSDLSNLKIYITPHWWML